MENRQDDAVLAKRVRGSLFGTSKPADGEAEPPPPPPEPEPPLKERPDLPRVVAYSDSSDDEQEAARNRRRAAEVRAFGVGRGAAAGGGPW